MHFKIMIATVLVGVFIVMPAQAVLEDPTRPPSANVSKNSSPKKQTRPRWMLTSTLISAGRRTAVVNDQVVSRGDRVNGARVMSVQPSIVRLRIGKRDITLMMLKKKIKKLSQVGVSGHHKK